MLHKQFRACYKGGIKPKYTAQTENHETQILEMASQRLQCLLKKYCFFFKFFMESGKYVKMCFGGFELLQSVADLVKGQILKMVI